MKLRYCAFIFLMMSVTNLFAQTLTAQIEGLDLVANKSQKIDLKFDLNSQSLKYTVILFLSSRCPCSNSHINEIKELYSLYGSPSNIAMANFVAIHSNQNETQQEAEKYFQKNNIKFPVISDVDAKIADIFKAFKTPHVFVLNNHAEIIYRGGVSSSQHFSENVKKYLRDVLFDLSKGEKPRWTETRSLGCVILRSP